MPKYMGYNGVVFMWKMSHTEREDLGSIASDRTIDWVRFEGKTVVVSGATGLIGCILVKALLYGGSFLKKSPKVIALVRDIKKAEKQFAAQLSYGCPLLIKQWSAEQILELAEPVHFIFHCASQTSSSGFMEVPVETIQTSYYGTESILTFARAKQVEHVVYLSSMEVYGIPQDDQKIDETYIGKIDPLKVRSCYPESKRMCENLCVSYASEYQVPTSIARLTQTFGPGIASTDRRVFAEFARCVIEKKDIVLHTKGETKRNYLYTADAVRALLLIALKGEIGQAYNVANEDTYCTIYEMAQLVAEKIGKNEIAVCIELVEDINQYGYAPTLHMNLDTTKLCQLGWRSQFGLQTMFERMIAEFKE